VYHNHLHNWIKVKVHVKTGILDYSANLKAKSIEVYDSIPCGPLRQAASAPGPAPDDPPPAVAAADLPAPEADPAAAGDVVSPAAAAADVVGAAPEKPPPPPSQRSSRGQPPSVEVEGRREGLGRRRWASWLGIGWGADRRRDTGRRRVPDRRAAAGSWTAAGSRAAAGPGAGGS
jgi:hypothetical protein